MNTLKTILCLLIFQLSGFVSACQNSIANQIKCSEKIRFGFARTGVIFNSQDFLLQQLYDMAERKAISNIRYFTSRYTVMVEGGGYPFVWIETQPMGGVMYAKRDIHISYDNVMIFTNNQRSDGRMAAMIGDFGYLTNEKRFEGWLSSSKSWVKSEHGKLGLNFDGLQGLYLAHPALELYYLLNRDISYLNSIYNALEAYDKYLWKYRDSDGDGCLETWGMTDNGEDHLERFRYAPWSWPSNTAPKLDKYANISDKNDIGNCPLPEESMDVMGYSFSCRDVLAKISAIRKDGKETYWRNKASEVSKKMKDYLWLPEKKAYCYRDKNNNLVNSLVHNNIRTMFFGTMNQTMADDFIRFHLLNPDEFWTPMPLTSIAANDPFFKNLKNNNWSGQPQGLTYQRAIRALENYGHCAEVGLIGSKLLAQVSKTVLFTQQFDPYTGEQNGSDNYGPTILSVLEYISRMYGVYLENELVHFNGLAHNKEYDYTQIFSCNKYKIELKKTSIKGYLNEKELFSCTAGVSVVTDLQGKFIHIIGIDSITRNVELNLNGRIYLVNVSPNCTYIITNNKLVLENKVPFDYPYKKPE